MTYFTCHCTVVLAEVNIWSVHSRGQHLCLFNGEKKSVYITKKLSCFIVLEHQCGRLYVIHVKNLLK